MSIVSIRDLVVEYDGHRVLDNLSLDIEHGETMVLLGGSGSGKSTLLRQILGLERPKSGSVFVKGVDIVHCSAAELKKVRRSIGVAFQSAALFNSLSVEDNVALTLREHTRLAPSIIELMVWMNLAVVGLADFGKLYPQELSGGMKKRAAVANRWCSSARSLKIFKRCATASGRAPPTTRCETSLLFWQAVAGVAISSRGSAQLNSRFSPSMRSRPARP